MAGDEARCDGPSVRGSPQRALAACGGTGDGATDAGADAGPGVMCGSATCAPGLQCCFLGCTEQGDPILVCDDDCAFNPTGPIWECD